MSVTQVHTVSIIWYGSEASAWTTAFTSRPRAEAFFNKVSTMIEGRDDVVVSFDSGKVNDEQYLQMLEKELVEG